MSYTGAQIFEAVGLARSLVDKYFTGTTSSIEGMGVFEVAEEAIRIHKAAFDDADPVLQSMLDAGGEYAWRVRGRRTHVDARRDREAAALGRGRTPPRRTRSTRRSSTTSPSAT